MKEQSNLSKMVVEGRQGEARALDIHLSSILPDQKLTADKLCRILIAASAQLALDKVIWNRTIWSRAQGQKPYQRSDPHIHYIHVEFVWPNIPANVWRILDAQVAQVPRK